MRQNSPSLVTWPPRSSCWSFSSCFPDDAGSSDAQLGRSIKYGNEDKWVIFHLSNMVGFPHGSEFHPHVCRGRPGGQPVGGGDPSRNSASNVEPPNPGPGTAAQGAVAGALSARHKTDRRWDKAVRARQPRHRGALGG